MSEPKFTPGPWIAVSRGCFGETHEADVHECAKWDVDMDDGEFMRGNFRMEDANLIAAAPELYEALRIAAKDLHMAACMISPEINPAFFETVKRARAVLDKARGE